MTELFALKEATVAATPLLCFEIRFWDGHIERVAAESVTVGGDSYTRRVVAQQLHENSLGGKDAIGYYARVGLTLSNTDGLMTQLETARGFRGLELHVRFVFVDAASGESQAAPMHVFRGILDAPSLIDESRIVLMAENRFSFHHAKLPSTPIQRRCPWHFPFDAQAREEAANGGAEGRHSLFYRCGYSPNVAGGAGNLGPEGPYSGCRGSRDDCAARGMLSEDAAGNATRRFGGVTYLPASILVRTHGSRALQAAQIRANEARGNDVAPLVYGRGWLSPALIHSVNDGNLTRLLYLVADGEVDGVERVVVNGVEIPAAVAGRDMTASGWHKLVGTGAREGSFLPKPDDNGVYEESDPHGSMATLEVVIPNAMQRGSGQPQTEVWLRGLKLLTIASDGSEAARQFTDNPSWVLLDLLLRSGWRRDELRLESFASAAAYCAEPIQVGLWGGATHMQPRFSCNLVLQKRRSLGELLRGLREASFLYLREGFDGKLEAVTEGTMAQQQPVASALSNATATLAGGWPVYEFGDGTAGRSGILRNATGAPVFRLFSRGVAESPNRIHAEFQDAWNGFQTDRISLFDSREIHRNRQEITGNSNALGLSTYHQAARAVYVQLKHATTGNRFVEFETGLRGIGVRPGDLITVSYPRYGLDRQSFRVLRVRQSADLEGSTITAQWHEDAWYADTILEELGGLDRYRQPAGSYGTARPLSGALVQPDGSSQFGISEVSEVSSDGSYRVALACEFLRPRTQLSATLAAPVTALVPKVQPGAGQLAPGSTLYYRFTSVDANGEESNASPPVVATLPTAGSGYTVEVASISTGSGASGIRVYRGEQPDVMFLVATLPGGATSFADAGLTYQPTVLPDPSFAHANFYWRRELHPVVGVGSADAGSVTAALATWQENEFQGRTVWIVNGTGRGQERTILSNNANTLFVDQWMKTPDASSSFAITEATWQSGTKSAESPVTIEVPNFSGSVVQVLGVSANALGSESAIDRAVITRWQIGGGSVFPTDTDVPAEPLFSLDADGAGMLLLSGIGFPDLENTTTIQSGTLQLYYYDELRDLSTVTLASAVTDASTQLQFSGETGLFEQDLFQLNREILRVVAKGPGNTLTVERGVLGSVVAGHNVSSRPFALSPRGMVFPVPLQFFGSPASANFRQPLYLPHARIAAAALRFTNSVGQSPEAVQTFTPLSEFGLRTGYGGQYALYVEGYLAIEDDAAIPLIVDRDHSVRDVVATLESPPTAGPAEIDVLVDGAVYCSLVFAQGATFSNVVSGVGLPPIREGSRLTVNVRSVVHYGNTIPGRDLSIRIRL
jgi:hypothetical protein